MAALEDIDVPTHVLTLITFQHYPSNYTILTQLTTNLVPDDVHHK